MEHPKKKSQLLVPFISEREIDHARREFLSSNIRLGIAGGIGTWMAPLSALASGIYTSAFFKQNTARRTGTLWGSGNDANAQLGTGPTFTGHKSTPVQIGSVSSWVQISGGYTHSLGVRSDGSLWGWGYNQEGEVGNSSVVTPITSPVRIGSLNNWYQVAAGFQHSAAIKTDGTLWTWGNNNHFQLGTGNGTARSSPVQVGSLTNWKSVATGYFHTMAIKKDGTLWVWGSALFGELGINSTTERSSPVQVGTGTNWISVGGGNGMTGAVKSDGTLWTWGDNSVGTLGSNTVVGRSSPVQVGSLTNWRRIEVFENQMGALRSDGTVWVWGKNDLGQLGDGTRTNRSSPVQFGSSTWYDFSLGGWSTYGIKPNGTLWGTGENGAGAIGDGTIVSKSSPVQVGSLTTWIKISGGGYHFLALKN